MPVNDVSPRPEHPRPDWRRGANRSLLVLNGKWDFRFDPEGVGEAEGWPTGEVGFDRQIVVPFPWESHAAWGTEAWAGNDDWFSAQAYLDPRSVTKENYREAPRHTIGWYRRAVRTPELAPAERLWLNIGAADWEVKVWVNGRFVAEGRSGYVPFACDVTEAVEATTDRDAIIVIRVHDPQGTEDKPLGKQHQWYTTTSGIWQPVWLEVRPERHITRVHLTPHLQPAGVECVVATHGDGAGLFCRIVVRDEEGTVVADHCDVCDRKHTILLGGELRPWHPDDPHLYEVTVQLLESETVVDEVQTYFGLREVGVSPLYEGGPQYITLNGQPIYLKGALNQSFNPWGVYAWRSDEDIIRDLTLAKQAGFNFLRLHIKPEDPRFLYWADKLGMLIMYDFPNLGYEGYGEVGCERWEWTLRELLARDYNHPCIFAWVLFNETWGLGFNEYAQSPQRQEWVKRMYRLAKELDPSRLVEDNSACSYDHVLTDINSWHFYINDYERAKEHIAHVVAETYPGSTFNYVGGNEQKDEPLLNSEYGGISARMGDLDVSWCFKFLTDLLRKQEKICGYVYTELQDIEWEYNGIVNYDRSRKDFGYEVKDLQGPVYLGFDGPPAQTVRPFTTFTPRFYVNSIGFEGPLPPVRWRVTDMDSLGRENVWFEQETLCPGRGVIACDELVPPMAFNSSERSLVKIEGWVEGLAYNFIYLEVCGESLPAVHRCGGGAIVLRKLAGDVEVSTAWHEAEVERGVVDYETHLLGGVEAGHMDYRFVLPEGVDLSGATLLTFLCEASSKRPGAPQTHTDGPGWPSDLIIWMNGVPVHSRTLPDQYADSRGALSHLHGFRGRYGELVRVEVKGEMLDRVRQGNAREVLVRLEVPRSALNHRGLVVYSSRAGRYPCDVTLVVS